MSKSSKPKNWKFPNAKDKLNKNLKDEVLKKYGPMLGPDHPFNNLKEKEKFKDMEKHFIKGGNKDKTQEPKPKGKKTKGMK
tara:strand:- start:197 stop:439 length:243 start_codon:yes stop_codon:yes gene_type:complete